MGSRFDTSLSSLLTHQSFLTLYKMIKRVLNKERTMTTSTMRIVSLLLLAFMTILLVSHYLLGYDSSLVVSLWICIVAITIAPVLQLVYGNTDDDIFDDSSKNLS